LGHRVFRIIGVLLVARTYERGRYPPPAPYPLSYHLGVVCVKIIAVDIHRLVAQLGQVFYDRC